MPRSPRDPDNPLSSRGKTLVLKLTDSLDDELTAVCAQREQSRAEVGRELLQRGLNHLAIESAPLNSAEDARPVFEREVEYAWNRLSLVFADQALTDPGGAVVSARRLARALAQWADEKAESNGLLLDRMTGGV